MADWSVLLRPTPRRILEAVSQGARTLTELSVATGIKKPALAPHLKQLVGAGVLRHERLATPTGSEARYEPSDVAIHVEMRARDATLLTWATLGPSHPDAPLLSQVPQSELREEAAAFLRALRASAGLLSDEVTVLLFGSAARGDATWKSDIDLLVLAQENARDEVAEHVERAAYEASMRSQHAVVPTLATFKEFEERPKRIHQEAKREGMIIWAPRGDLAPWGKLERYRRFAL